MSKNIQELEAEVARLTEELEQEREKSAGLQRQIDAMRQQEASMAALFHGAQPTIEGRLAHARVTGHRR